MDSIVVAIYIDEFYKILAIASAAGFLTVARLTVKSIKERRSFSKLEAGLNKDIDVKRYFEPRVFYGEGRNSGWGYAFTASERPHWFKWYRLGLWWSLFLPRCDTGLPDTDSEVRDLVSDEKVS